MSITPGFKSKRRLLLSAIKRPADTKGTNYISAGAPAQAMLTKGLTVDPLVTEQISRDLDDGLNGGQPVIHVNEMINITAPIEVAGSGAANTPVAFASLLQMAGYDVDTTDPSEVSYNRILNAADELDGTNHFHWENMYHALLAGKCTLSIAGKIGELMYITAEIKGIYGDTVELAIPNGDFSAYTTPLHMSQANTQFTLDGQALNLYEFEESLNNTIEYDEGTEVKQIFIDDWSPEGRFLIEAPSLSTFDPFAILKANTQMPYTLTHGTAPGQIWDQRSDAIQLLSVKSGEYKGKQCWDLSYRVLRGSDTVFRSR
ncbi:MAG: hypothetical protein Alis3KO_01000 [Aliiglaciecola sp.]